MIEGDVVLILGKLDDRVRSADGEAYGTIVGIQNDDVVVLLTNLDLWVGKRWEVVKDE